MLCGIGHLNQQANFVCLASKKCVVGVNSRLTQCFWSYLSWHGIFTQGSYVVFGKNWSIVIYVQHCDQSDAFSNLSRIL